MVLDLKRVFTAGEPVSFSYQFDLSAIEWNSSRPFVSPVKAVGTVKSGAGAALLQAEVSFDFSIPCDRCAEPVHRRMDYSFQHTLVLSLNHEENDSFLEVKDYKLDLDELLRADILLELPTKFLCKPDCSGLCPDCGQNWNLAPCQCNKHQVDPRLEILQSLID